MEDQIKLSGISLQTRLGVTQTERDWPQTVFIDVALYTDTRVAGKSDKIEDTINYDEVYEVIRQECSEPHNLIEALAENLCSKLHSHFYLSRVTLTLKKIPANLKSQGIDSVSIEITR